MSLARLERKVSELEEMIEKQNKKIQKKQMWFSIATIILIVLVSICTLYCSRADHFDEITRLVDWLPAILPAAMGIMLFLCMKKMKDWDDEMIQNREKTDEKINNARRELEDRINNAKDELRSRVDSLQALKNK